MNISVQYVIYHGQMVFVSNYDETLSKSYELDVMFVIARSWNALTNLNLRTEPVKSPHQRQPRPHGTLTPM